MTKLRGSAFDKAYIVAQLAGHEAAVVLYSHEINKGQNATAKAYASNKLPGIIGHTAMLYETAAKVKAPGYGLRPVPVREEAPAAANEHEKMAEMMMEQKGAM